MKEEHKAILQAAQPKPKRVANPSESQLHILQVREKAIRSCLSELELAIMSTPSGLERDALCDANLLILTVQRGETRVLRNLRRRN
jgi:hypothetical protein